LPEQVVFRTVVHEGGQGRELGRLTQAETGIEATPGIASQTLAMLQRRHRATGEQVFARLHGHGWTNGQILAAAADPDEA
jgi:hypothetical protein